MSFVSLEAFVLRNELCRGQGARGTLQQQAELWGGSSRGRGALQARLLALPKSTFLTGKDPRKHKVMVTGQPCTQHPQRPGDTRPSSPQKPSAGGRGPASLPTGSIAKRQEGRRIQRGCRSGPTSITFPGSQGPAWTRPAHPSVRVEGHF